MRQTMRVLLVWKLEKGHEIDVHHPALQAEFHGEPR
jgi:hypothetical protein